MNVRFLRFTTIPRSDRPNDRMRLRKLFLSQAPIP